MTTAVQNNNEEAFRATNSIAMVVVLTSFAMLFATLFLGYAIYRLTSNVWPPAGMQSLPMLVPTVSTVLIILSSLSLWSFQTAYLQKKGAKYSLLASIALGTGFIICQFALWSGLKSSGLLVGTNIFTSIIYAFTWIHMAHMAAAMIGLLLLLKPALTSNFEKQNLIDNVSKFWHFLGIIWLIIFLTIFVI